VINDGLHYQKLVKVKGLGTFKTIAVKDRESVNVNTGERILIEGRDKITFTPDASLRDFVNKPFAQFDTVMVNDGVDFPDTETVTSDTAENTEETAPEITEEAASAAALAAAGVAVAEGVKAETAPAMSALVSKPLADNGAEEVKETPADAAEPMEETVVETPVEEEPVEKPAAETPVEEEPIAESVTGAAETTTEPEPAPVEPEPGSIETEAVTAAAAPISAAVKASVPAADEEASVAEDSVPAAGTEQAPETEEQAPVTEEESVPAVAREEVQLAVEEKVEETEDNTEEIDEIEEEMNRQEVKRTKQFMGALAVLFLLAGLIMGFLFGKATRDKGTMQGTMQTEIDSLKTELMKVKVDNEALGEEGVLQEGIVEEETVNADVPLTDGAATPSEGADSRRKDSTCSPIRSDFSRNGRLHNDPRVRTGAYRIAGVAEEVTVRAGQTLASISKAHLGPGMECYVEALNGTKTVEEGQKIKIPKLELKGK